MRWILGIVVVLLLGGWLACQIEMTSAHAGQPRIEDGWRRTTRGWERLVSLKTPSASGVVPFWRLHPHPFVATLLLVMLSVLLLVACTEGVIFDAGACRRLIANRGSDST